MKKYRYLRVTKPNKIIKPKTVYDRNKDYTEYSQQFRGLNFELSRKCPMCDEGKLKVITVEDIFYVESKPIEILYRLYECDGCNEKIIDFEELDDPFKMAQLKYEKNVKGPNSDL